MNINNLQQSLAICRAIGDQAGLCPTLFNIGHIHRINEELDQAVGYWVVTYRIAREIGYAQILNALDKLAKHQGGLEYWEMLARQVADDN